MQMNKNEVANTVTKKKITQQHESHVEWRMSPKAKLTD